MKQDIANKLNIFICENFFVEEDEFDNDESLIDQDIIDSFGLVEIFTFMEATFRIRIGESQMSRENFGSFNRMVSFIEAELEALNEAKQGGL